MNSGTVAIFGIPLDHSPMDETAARICCMVEVYRRDQHRRRVVAVNGDFVVKVNHRFRPAKRNRLFPLARGLAGGRRIVEESA